MSLAAPFPWFGGKRKVADEVWSRFGTVGNYVEPFFGSGAVLFGRPAPFAGNETINDLDGFVANFWRALKHAPEETASHADNPVNENDLHARHAWLVAQRDSLRERLEGNPEFFDARIAGWWVWGISCWIAGGWCTGKGPWRVVEGRLVRVGGDAGRGIKRQRPHLGDAGRGVNQKRDLLPWFHALSARLATVRVASGDWSRVCGPSVTFKCGHADYITGVFLDPPYSDKAARAANLYRTDSLSVAHAVREWALENGKRKDMRIALCGYEGEHDMPQDWAVYSWNAGEGFGGQAEKRSGNGRRERIWFSPHCLSARQRSLFDRQNAAGGAR